MEEERNQNYTIAEDYYLPSKGLIYDTPVEPRVELRSMTARDELKRTNPSSTPFKKMADIIEGCMITKPAVHVYDMALGDYEYLLQKLRVVTYGSEYKLSLVCNNCGELIDATTDLDNLEVKEFDQAKFEELRAFELPASKNKIEIYFQTPHMLDYIEATVKELKNKPAYKNAEIDINTFVLLKTIINTVNGTKLSTTELETFINTLPAKDMIKILNNIDRLNACVGLNTKFIVSCDKCGGEVSASFHFSPEFFRPADI